MEKSNTETKLISVRIPLELHDFILSPLNKGSITDFTIEALKLYAWGILTKLEYDIGNVDAAVEKTERGERTIKIREYKKYFE